MLNSHMLFSITFIIHIQRILFLCITVAYFINPINNLMAESTDVCPEQNIMTVTDQTFIDYFADKTHKIVDRCYICYEKMILSDNIDSDELSYLNINDVLASLKTKELIKCCQDTRHLFHTSCFLLAFAISSNNKCICQYSRCDCDHYFKIFFHVLLNRACIEKESCENMPIKAILDKFISNIKFNKFKNLLCIEKLNQRHVEYLIDLIDNNISKDRLYNQYKIDIKILLVSKMQTNEVFDVFINSQKPSVQLFDRFINDIAHSIIQNRSEYIVLNTENRTLEFLSCYKYSFIEFIEMIFSKANNIKCLDINYINEKLLIFILSSFKNLKSSETKEFLKLLILNKSNLTNESLELDISKMCLNNEQINNRRNKKNLCLEIQHLIDLFELDEKLNEKLALWTLKFISSNIKIKALNYDERNKIISYFCDFSTKYKYKGIRILKYAIGIIEINDYTFSDMKNLVCIISKARSNDKIHHYWDDNRIYIPFINDMSIFIKFSKSEIYELLNIALENIAPEITTYMAIVIIKRGCDDNEGIELLKLILPILSNSYLFKYFIYSACKNKVINSSTIESYMLFFDNNENLNATQETFCSLIIKYVCSNKNLSILSPMLPYTSTKLLYELNDHMPGKITNLFITNVYMSTDKNDYIRNALLKFDKNDNSFKNRPIAAFLTKHFVNLYKTIVMDNIDHKVAEYIVSLLNNDFSISNRFSELVYCSGNRNVLLDIWDIKNLYSILKMNKNWKLFAILLNISNIDKILMIEALKTIVIRLDKLYYRLPKQDYPNSVDNIIYSDDAYSVFISLAEKHFLEYLIINHKNVIDIIISTEAFKSAMKELFN